MNAVRDGRALDEFRSAIPLHPSLTSGVVAAGELGVGFWNTPWIRGFELPANDDLVLALHRQGGCEVRALWNGEWSERQSSPGLITAIPPQRESAFQVDGEVSFETVHIPTRRIRTVARRHSLDNRMPDFRFAFHDHYVGACVEAIVGEARSPRPKSEELIQAVTESLLLHLLLRSSLAACAFGPQTSAPIERGRALIEASVGRGLTINELAEEAGISRSHFIRRFRAETGVSPHRYLSQRRIDKAKTMLLETDMELVDIALDLGFCSQSHFTQVFHALAGITPRKFRENNTAAGN
jgi:AraC family transcriptional regulator